MLQSGNTHSFFRKCELVSLQEKAVAADCLMGEGQLWPAQQPLFSVTGISVWDRAMLIPLLVGVPVWCMKLLKMEKTKRKRQSCLKEATNKSVSVMIKKLIFFSWKIPEVERKTLKMALLNEERYMFSKILTFLVCITFMLPTQPCLFLTFLTM